MTQVAESPTADLENAPCPQCGSDRLTVRLQAPDHQVQAPGLFFASRCGRCGLLFQSPRVSFEQLSKHYPPEYASYLVEDIRLTEAERWHLQTHQGYGHIGKTPRPATNERRFGKTRCANRLLPDYVPDGAVLEFGCASGNRLLLLQELGWKTCIGSEYSPEAAELARGRGLDVITGPIEEALKTIPDGSLDVVISNFVVEHLVDPFSVAPQIARKLKPGGRFIFSTINIRTPDFWVYKSFWYNLDLPRHMVFFRKKDVVAMLDREFEIEKLTFESAPHDYLVSAKYRRRAGGPGKWLDLVLLRIGGRLRRPLNLLASLGLGARIFVVARKR